MRKHQVADRLFMCVIIALVVVASFSDTTISRYGLTPLQGWAAGVSRVFLGVLVVLALADTLVNDVLPENYRVSISLYFRQLIWMFMAITLLGYAYVNVRGDTSVMTVVWLSLFGLRSASVALLDLHHEIAQSSGGQ